MREGKAAQHISEVMSFRNSESYFSNPEFKVDVEELLKQKNHFNREVGNHMDTITAAQLISLRNENPDDQTAE
jgi:hypothetical protein